tara:strand:+ start:232 stop:504 length:273 start_codon:yes stop_codon:yes gene_type:complete
MKTLNKGYNDFNVGDLVRYYNDGHKQKEIRDLPGTTGVVTEIQTHETPKQAAFNIAIKIKYINETNSTVWYSRINMGQLNNIEILVKAKK